MGPLAASRALPSAYAPSLLWPDLALAWPLSLLASAHPPLCPAGPLQRPQSFWMLLRAWRGRTSGAAMTCCSCPPASPTVGACAASARCLRAPLVSPAHAALISRACPPIASCPKCYTFVDLSVCLGAGGMENPCLTFVTVSAPAVLMRQLALQRRQQLCTALQSLYCCASR